MLFARTLKRLQSSVRSLPIAAVAVPIVMGSAMLLVPSDARARADFDAATATLRMAPDALRRFDFESNDGAAAFSRVRWVEANGFPALERTPMDREWVSSMLTSSPDDAVEGAHALRVGVDGTGLALMDPELFSNVLHDKFEVSLWARADGVGPQLWVVYDKTPDNVFSGTVPFATVRGVRTGRETSDGWAEYSTGPLDGNVWGVPARGVVVTVSSAAAATDSFVLDALEVRKVPGKPVEPVACTTDTVDAVCGAGGDCMFGHCISSTVTWGVLPSLAHRREIAERWIHIGTRVIGDRNAAKNGEAILKPGARALAESAVSSRQFFGGLNRLVNLLRDNHTSFGAPGTFTSFAPQVDWGSSSVLGACFGVVQKDLLDGKLGYAVFRAADKPLTRVALKRGDVLFAIDGRDPKAWVDEVWPYVATTLPNDPASDWGMSANALSRLIGTRARNITVLRCASASDCSASSRQTITIDVAKTAFEALTGDATAEGADEVSRSFGCSQRFLEAVTTRPSPGAAGAGSGEDPVYTMPGAHGETRVQFDGFGGRTKWQAAMSAVFANRPERVVMDTRMGHGGYYTAVEHLFNLLRGTSEPMGVISMGRGTFDLTDPPWLLERFGRCSGEGNENDVWSCYQGNANGFFAKETNPPGAATKIAWLNTYDVSANDFMPKLLKGRSNFRIFAPHPTSGAFGSVSGLPSLWTGWAGGSVQVQDARFAANLAEATAVRWESGHGVEPDVLVAQKLSDALTGVDTILEAATAWLHQ